MNTIKLLPKTLLIVFLLFLAIPTRLVPFFSVVPAYAQTCTTYGELINGSGWEDHGDISDGGKLVYLPDDASLPAGYEAIGDGASISLQDPDRYMASGWWSLYRNCTDDVPAPDESCPTIDGLLSSHGWEGVGETGDGGVVVQLFRPDSLPWGYEAIGDWSISVDTGDRYMPAGYWSIYRVSCD